MEIQVNPEFGSRKGKYNFPLPQLSADCPSACGQIWRRFGFIGMNPFGGGNNNLLIHI